MTDKLVPQDASSRAVGVAQLAKRSLLAPEVRGLNLIIGKIYIEYCFQSTVLKRRKKRKKWPVMAHFLKNDASSFLGTNSFKPAHSISFS